METAPMNATLDAALGECDTLGITLALVNGAPSVRPGEAGVPDELRQRLREHRGEITELLAANPRPDPDPVVFVARNLDVFRCPFAMARTAPPDGRGDRAYHRLTPRVWFYLATGVDRLAAAADRSKAGTYRQAAELLHALGLYLRDHFRPDQISRAARLGEELPEVRPPHVPTGPVPAKAK